MPPFMDILNSSPAVASTLALICLVWGVYKVLCIGSREEGLPPGPPTVPIFGNMLQMPSTQAEYQLTEWHKQYGPIISLKFGTSTWIIIADREAIRELWEKKSSIYSDRMESYVAGLLTDRHHAAFQSMGESWRDRRKLISHYYSPQMCDTVHAEYQNAEATAYMKGLLEKPERHFEETKRFSSAVTAVLTYGRRPQEFEDPICQDVVAAMGYIAENMEIGATPPIDEVPFRWMQSIPACFAPWKARAIGHGQKLNALFSGLWTELVDRRKSGVARTSLLDKFLDQQSEKDQPLGDWKWGLHSLQFLGGEILEGGADTTSSTLLSFMMAMACNPEVQKKAQTQIDAAVGANRSPVWSDYDSIPYVAQIQKESMRWRSVTVLGTPHVAREEGTYKQYRIPKGARTIQNTWALHMDPEFFPDPDAFKPERYEGRTKLADHYQGNSDWKSRDHYAYGGGRRICPGMHLAERNLWRAISKILWAFDIQQIGDVPLSTEPFTINGKVAAFERGAVRIAHRFKVSIKPRSAKHVEIIQREYSEVFQLLEAYH